MALHSNIIVPRATLQGAYSQTVHMYGRSIWTKLEVNELLDQRGQINLGRYWSRQYTTRIRPCSVPTIYHPILITIVP